jgi:hypothetical protein
MKVLVITLLALISVSLVFGQTLRAQLESSDAKVLKAMKAKDMATIEKLFTAASTKDFLYVENGQKQDMKTMLQNMKLGFQSMKKITKATLKTLTLKQTGDKAVSTRQHAMDGIMVGPDGKEHKMSFSGVSEDQYVRVKGKWLMKRMEWKSQKMLMDGKPMGAPTGG